MSNKYGTLKSGKDTIFPVCQTKRGIVEGTVTAATSNAGTLGPNSYAGNAWTAGTWTQKGVMADSNYRLKVVVPAGETWVVKLSASVGTLLTASGSVWGLIGIYEADSSLNVITNFGVSVFRCGFDEEFRNANFETMQVLKSGTHYFVPFVKTDGNVTYIASPTLTTAPNMQQQTGYGLGPSCVFTAQIVERIKS